MLPLYDYGIVLLKYYVFKIFFPLLHDLVKIGELEILSENDTVGHIWSDSLPERMAWCISDKSTPNIFLMLA